MKSNYERIIKLYNDKMIMWVMSCVIDFWCSSTMELEEHFNSFSEKEISELEEMLKRDFKKKHFIKTNKYEKTRETR